jgi:hypothetical protein
VKGHRHGGVHAAKPVSWGERAPEQLAANANYGYDRIAVAEFSCQTFAHLEEYLNDALPSPYFALAEQSLQIKTDFASE